MSLNCFSRAITKFCWNFHHLKVLWFLLQFFTVRAQDDVLWEDYFSGNPMFSERNSGAQFSHEEKQKILLILKLSKSVCHVLLFFVFLTMPRSPNSVLLYHFEITFAPHKKLKLLLENVFLTPWFNINMTGISSMFMKQSFWTAEQKSVFFIF